MFGFTVRRFFLLGTLVGLTAQSISNAQEMFPSDRVQRVEINLKQEDWEELCGQTRDIFTALGEDRQYQVPESPYSYFEAHVVFDGKDLGTVGIRKKGFVGSQSVERPSLKIKLDYKKKKDENKWNDYTKLTLNNNRQDETLMDQYLGYAFFRKAGVPAPLCSYAQVTVNGKNLGIYSHVESIGRPLLKREFEDDEGTLFEGTVTDFYEGWERSFERKVGKKSIGRKAIRRLTKALQSTSSKQLLRTDSLARAWVPTHGHDDESWFKSDFDDTNWKSGSAGAGYELNDGYHELISDDFNLAESLSGKATSLYLRYRFRVEDASKLAGNVYLRLKYDDGFVAYLNGSNIAEFNAPKELSFESTATASHEGNTASFESYPIDQRLLKNGENVLAIHALNVAASSSDMLVLAKVDATDADPESVIGQHVDLDSFYRYWATEGLLGFWDGYAANRNNYFFYVHPETKKSHFIPWGADALFETYSHLRRDLREPISVKTTGLIPYRLYESESGRKRYFHTLQQLFDDVWDEDELVHEVDRIETMIRPFVSTNQRLETSAIRDFIKNRCQAIRDEIADALPVWRAAPYEPTLIKLPDPTDGPDTIWLAARTGDVEGLQRHLAVRTDVNSRDRLGSTPLSLAVTFGKSEAVEFLLDNGADIHSLDRGNSTPLHTAALFGHRRVVELLLSHRANLNAKNNGGETPLDSANGDWNQARGLIQFVGRLGGVEFDMDEVKSGRQASANLLAEHGGKTGKQIPDSNIWVAAKAGELPVIEKCSVEQINRSDGNGITPLKWAVLAQQNAAVELLLRRGADVDDAGLDGSTALHTAAFVGNDTAVNLLLKQGGDATKTNARGETAHDVAATEINAASVQGIAGALGIPLDESKLRSGRSKAIELLGTKPSQR